MKRSDDGECSHVSVNYDVQTDAVGFDKCPRLYPILSVVFGKPGELYRNHERRKLARSNAEQ